MGNETKKYNGKSHALLAAVKSGEIIAAEALLRAVASVDIQDTEDENTPLHRAIINKDWYMLELLLNWGADITVKNKKGKTPAVLAAEIDYIAGIKLIASKRNTDAEDRADYASALKLMVWKNHRNTAEALLEVGADPNKSLCLHVAALRSDLEMVRLLLGYGADQNAEDSSNKTPIQVASDHERWPHVTMMANWRAPTPLALFEMLKTCHPLHNIEYEKLAWRKPQLFAHMLRLPTLELKQEAFNLSLDIRHPFNKLYSTKRGLFTTDYNSGYLKKLADEHKAIKSKMMQTDMDCLPEDRGDSCEASHVATAPPLTPPLSPDRVEPVLPVSSNMIELMPLLPSAGIQTLMRQVEELPSPSHLRSFTVFNPNANVTSNTSSANQPKKESSYSM